MDEIWHIELLGGLRATSGDRVITRFPTRQTGALLAYLAYHSHRSHPRELLIEQLWPESAPRAGRLRLRVALTSLRRQLEPPGVPPGAVIVAAGDLVQLNRGAFTTDVAEFEAALQSAGQIGTDPRRVDWLTRAIERYRGPLLAGYHEDWIVAERQRLDEAFHRAVDQLVHYWENAGDPVQAAQWLRRSLAVDPLREEAHHELIRLLVAAGQPDAALAQYRELERLLATHLDVTPADETRALVQDLKPRVRRARPGSASTRRIVLRARRPADGAAGGADGVSAARQPAQKSEPPVSRLPPASPRYQGFLPLQLARFFGREAEIAELVELLGATGGRGDGGTGRPGKVSGRDGPVLGPVGSPHLPVAPSPRLVTLTGPAGSGKTRLAVEVGRALRGEFDGAVWFVALADLTTPRLILDRIQDALRLPRAPGVDLLEQVVTFLSRQRSLLLLDNFEHLLNASPEGGEPGPADGAAVIWTLLERVDELRVLVTSRHRLELPGEREFPVAPLPVPVDGPWLIVDGTAKSGRSGPSTINHQLSALTQCPSVALLVDRAQAARPDFQVTGRNAGAVAALCRRLEGLPLALELAGARAGVLTPQQMLDRLEATRTGPFGAGAPSADGTSLDLLATRGWRMDPRHRSLRAALDGSFQLLSSELQRFFARLSVFRGGWTLEAAEAVCSDFGFWILDFGLPAKADVAEPSDASDLAGPIQNPKSKIQDGTLLEYLEELQACSLVLVEETGVQGFRGSGSTKNEHEHEHEAGHLNPRTPEPLNPRTPEHLNPEIRFRMLEALREYGAEQLSAEEREELGRRHAQYCLALAEEANRKILGPEMEIWLSQLKAEHGNMRAALAWALAHQETETALRLASALPEFWNMEGCLSEGRSWLEASLQLPGASAPTALRGLALNGVGHLAWLQGDFAAARAAFGESIPLWREIGDKVRLAQALNMLGWVEQQSGGDLAAARAAREESLALFREAGDLGMIAWGTHCLGRSAAEEGDYEAARRLHEEAVVLYRAQGDPYSLSNPLLGLGHIAQRQGHYAAARGYFAEALALRQRYSSQCHATSNALENLAMADWCLGDWQAAIRGLEECVDLRRTGGMQQLMAPALLQLRKVAQSAGAPERAAAPLRESLELYRKYGNRKGEAQALIALGRLACEQRSAEAPPLLRDGLALAHEVSDRALVATALVETAALLSDQNAALQWKRAARLLGAAHAIRQSLAALVPPPERARHDQQREAIRGALGDAAFQAAWTAGQALTLEQAVAEALQALGGCDARFGHSP